MAGTGATGRSLNTISFVSVDHMMRLVLAVGTETFLTELAEVIEKAASDYAAEVKERIFPGQEHTFQIRPKK